MQRAGITDLEKLRLYLKEKIKQKTGDQELEIEIIPENRRCLYDRSASLSDLQGMLGITDEEFAEGFRVTERVKVAEPPSEENPVYVVTFLIRFSPHYRHNLSVQNGLIMMGETVFPRAESWKNRYDKSTIKSGFGREEDKTIGVIDLGVPPAIALKQVEKNDPVLFKKIIDGTQSR